MKKTLVGFLALLVVLCSVFTSTAGDIADRSSVKPGATDDDLGGVYTLLYTCTAITNVGLSFKGNVASCVGNVDAISSKSSVSISVTLQKKHGTEWGNEKTWTKSGTGYATIGGTFTVSSGSYRTRLNSTVKTTSGTSESLTNYTGIRTYTK